MNWNHWIHSPVYCHYTTEDTVINTFHLVIKFLIRLFQRTLVFVKIHDAVPTCTVPAHHLLQTSQNGIRFKITDRYPEYFPILRQRSCFMSSASNSSGPSLLPQNAHILASARLFLSSLHDLCMALSLLSLCVRSVSFTVVIRSTAVRSYQT